MKQRRVVTIACACLFLALVVVALMRYLSPDKPAIKITDPLTTNDVAEISRLVLSPRAPLLPGHFASPKDAVGVEMRERVAAELRSISSADGQTAVVDFADRWNPKIGYDYDLERTTNGW